MADAAPEVVYKCRSASGARQLTDLLCEAGIRARMAVPEPYTEFTIMPGIQHVHEVLAVGFDPIQLAVLIKTWESQQSEKDEPFDEPFCYHCGEVLTELSTLCPACSKPLDL